MNKKVINVVIFDQEKRVPERRTIFDTLDALQEIVGGNIEAVSPRLFSKHGMHLYVHDEGKFTEGILSNLYIHELDDILYGNIVCSACDENGEEIGLTAEQVLQAITIFHQLKSDQVREADRVGRMTLDTLIDNDGISPFFNREMALYRALRCKR